jgi:hydroxymethylbilane synthase
MEKQPGDGNPNSSLWMGRPVLLRISARQSDLARIQAHLVGQALQKNNPGLKIEYHFRESLGDKNLTDALWKMPEKGVFTEDFYQDLQNEKTDLVVHSWKDLPTENKPDTLIAATLPRGDQRDILLFKKTSVDKKPTTIKIFSSSPRRAHNLAPFLLKALPFKVEKAEFLTVRGHVQTRIRKLLESDETDGLIVAKAALDRMLMADADEFSKSKNLIRQALCQFHWMVLPLSENPNAAAQGALAIEIAAHRKDLRKILAEINCNSTYTCVQREREMLAAHGGGCHQKIGVSVLQRPYGRIEFTRGETPEGTSLDRVNFEPRHAIPWPELRPFLSSTSPPFQRRPIPFKIPLGTNAFYVSRKEGLSKDCEIKSEVVWTAGWTTWQKLAAEGIWVNGCSDGMGEDEIPDLCHLIGAPVIWCRLTHKDAPQDERLPSVATYEIIWQPLDLKTTDENIFFWRSSSQFVEALKSYPRLKNQFHACGPGRTYQIICETLGHSEKVFIFLNEDHWRQSWQKT